MADKLTGADISTVQRQSDVTSLQHRTNYANLKNKTNEIIDEIAAVAIGTTNAETTAARPYNTNLKERLDGILTAQYSLATGGVVTINGVDAQKVDISAGTGTINGIQVKIAGATSGTIAYTSANTRFDVVVGNTDSTYSVVTGAESATPSLPDVASTQIPLWVLTISTIAVALSHDARDQGCFYKNGGHLKRNFKIQDAIDDLSSGGTMFIGRGTYYEDLTYDDNQVLNFEGGTTLKTTAGVTVALEDIDITDKTDTYIKWSGGINGNGGRFVLGWKQTGNSDNIATTTRPSITALSSTRIAFIDETNDDLRTYDFDGTDWTQTGNDLNIADITAPSITKLSSTRIAFVDTTNDDLRTYDFDGTDWTQTGNDLFLRPITNPSITALSSTRIAFIDDTVDEVRTFTFDGTDWLVSSNSQSLGDVVRPSITTISSTQIVYIDDTNSRLETYTSLEIGSFTPTKSIF